MKVLILSSKDDNGGIGIAIKRAFDKHSTDITVRSVTREDNFIGWEKDIFWRYNDHAVAGFVGDLYKDADVIHVMDTFAAVEPFRGLGRKPMVMHHHGLDFRNGHKDILAHCKREGIVQVAATIDLLKFAPDDITYLPNPCDIDLMQELRQRYHRHSPMVRIAQTPTSQTANGTAHLLDAVDALPESVKDRIQLDLIHGLPWDACMKRKAQADLIVDSFVVAYGLTTIESWGLAIPVIHGSSDPWVEDKTVELLGFTPYYFASPATVGDAIREMVEDPELREEYAGKGWQVVNEHHSEEALVRNLTAVYERALS